MSSCRSQMFCMTYQPTPLPNSQPQVFDVDVIEADLSPRPWAMITVAVCFLTALTTIGAFTDILLDSSLRRSCCRYDYQLFEMCDGLINSAVIGPFSNRGSPRRMTASRNNRTAHARSEYTNSKTTNVERNSVQHIVCYFLDRIRMNR